MNLHRFWAVFIARNQEFLRDRASLIWNILMPLLIMIGFSLIFSNQSGLEPYKVGVYGMPAEPEKIDFFQMKYLQFVKTDDLQTAIRKVDRHQLHLLLDYPGGRYWVNESSPQGYLLERVLIGSLSKPMTREVLSGEAVRYLDWVMPGVLGMNMMFSAMFGVGYVIVRYRKSGVLKRLKATPLTALEFLTAQVLSRLLLIMTATILVYSVTDMLLDFQMLGSYFSLLLLFMTGTFSLISLSLIIASQVTSEEMAGGLLNLMIWPMMFLSGVWFSLEGAHPLLQYAALLMPLTHLLDGTRAIMIDGAGLLDIWPQLLTLSMMSLVFLLIGAARFRWEPE